MGTLIFFARHFFDAQPICGDLATWASTVHVVNPARQ